MNEDNPTNQPNDTLEGNLEEVRPTGAPTPVQAVGSIARLVIAVGIGLIAFIIAAAIFVISNFKQ